MPQTSLDALLAVSVFSLLACGQVTLAQEVQDSPLNQFKHGIPIAKIKCSVDHQLILKKSNRTPACVFPSSISVLIKRGWATMMHAITEEPIKQKNTKPVSVFAIFYISGSNHANLELSEKHLRSGDYLFITTPLDRDSDFTQLLQDTAEAKSKVVQGVHVISFVWYSKIDAIKLHSSYLPHDVDGIIYDYEKGEMYSPEFTTDGQKTLSLLNVASGISHNKGFKFMATPAFGYTVNNNEVEYPWDWTGISKDADFLVIQFQHFFKLNNANYIKTRIGNAVKDINITSDTPFIELSLTAIGGTANEDLQAMQDLEKVGIYKFLIFFESWKTSELEYIFEKRTELLD